MLYYFEVVNQTTGQVMTWGAFAHYKSFEDTVLAWNSILNDWATIETKLYYGRFSIPFYQNHFSLGEFQER